MGQSSRSIDPYGLSLSRAASYVKGDTEDRLHFIPLSPALEDKSTNSRPKFRSVNSTANRLLVTDTIQCKCLLLILN